MVMDRLRGCRYVGWTSKPGDAPDFVEPDWVDGDGEDDGDRRDRIGPPPSSTRSPRSHPRRSQLPSVLGGMRADGSRGFRRCVVENGMKGVTGSSATGG